MQTTARESSPRSSRPGSHAIQLCKPHMFSFPIPSISKQTTFRWRNILPPPPPLASSSAAGQPALKRKLEYPAVVPHYYYPAYPLPYQYLPLPATTWKRPKLGENTTPIVPEEPIQPTYVYCHQCRQRREKDETAHCSNVDVEVVKSNRPPITRRCHAKFCRSCLKEKYDEDLDTIKTNVPTHTKARIGEPYDFKCPKCSDTCTCWRCRKSKGPNDTAKNNTNGSKDRKGKGKAPDGPSDARPKRVARAKPVATRVLPALQWTKLHTSLSVEDAEARLHIREFVVRFFGGSIPKAHLEELEQIGGNGNSRFEDDEVVPWISEPCLKSVLLAFLGVLIEEESNGTIRKALQNGVKDLRATGLSLSKVWGILSSLRDSLDASEAGSSDGTQSDDSETVPTFPDPAPLPDSAKASSRRTRSTTFVIDTVQMIPVVLGLIDAVVESASIRAELENGSKEAKDVTRDAKEAIRNVNDRWEKVKKEMDTTKEHEFKAKRDSHKQLLKDVEGASKVANHRFNQRFAPLGSDRDGRIYYAMSPSASETEAAVEFLSVVASETDESKPSYKAKRKRRAKREDDQKSWSWFVAVHGTKPPPPLGTLPFKPVKAETDDESEDDETVDKWWAIDKPAEMRKLMTWLTTKYQLNVSVDAGVDPDVDHDSTVGSDTSSESELLQDRDVEMSPHASRLELLALVGNLEDFVSGLEYRIRDNDVGVLGLGDITTSTTTTKSKKA
ncbi:zf-4CXXC-R1 domain-containing protein [Mycena chlorophos]|uniref:Zf-4CXXC-R1 domain-containing protein n=1 Tax=Mycena chlorophos TaxID=658473 RepID=A0A8H6VXZ6_MYCCL|nr:zf-4CXXC-R1 domain-containing protein [Mycena chlorophos]